MTAEEFRQIALSFPDVIEASHMQHPDFRVNGRIFATLGSPDAKHGMVKLPVAMQHAFLQGAPEIFTPAAGAWGRGGSTLVWLAAASAVQVAEAMEAAWKEARQPKARTKSGAVSQPKR